MPLVSASSQVLDGGSSPNCVISVWTRNTSSSQLEEPTLTEAVVSGKENVVVEDGKEMVVVGIKLTFEFGASSSNSDALVCKGFLSGQSPLSNMVEPLWNEDNGFDIEEHPCRDDETGFSGDGHGAGLGFRSLRGGRRGAGGPFPRIAGGGREAYQGRKCYPKSISSKCNLQNSSLLSSGALTPPFKSADVCTSRKVAADIGPTTNQVPSTSEPPFYMVGQRFLMKG